MEGSDAARLSVFCMSLILNGYTLPYKWNEVEELAHDVTSNVSLKFNLDPIISQAALFVKDRPLSTYARNR